MSNFPRTYPTVDQALRTYREMRAHGLSEHVVPPISSGHVLAVEVEKLAAELQRFREREPLVQRLIERLDPRNPADEPPMVEWVNEIEADACAILDFELTPSVKCPSQADDSANDLAPGTPGDAAESHEKGGSDAG